ncbi:hypothetical protein KBX17_05295 [Corynebacterium sp. CCUG 65737]|uniref:hypothetical protein n=1 Tax=Corynebacterium sp. CCUG 65737 TaxID=2823889 RepID=UPI00210AB3C3|nr:hypothetical protein [Corynebacterium sp. CCUG 65737]MCQ4627223.1 hypothetical protein [Corynebacterium sp. CCUG 65737]
MDHAKLTKETDGHVPRDDAFYHRALTRIDETDRLIPQLRSALAAGAGKQWQRAKADIHPLPERKRPGKGVTRAMRSVEQIDRTATLAAVLAGAEQGDVDARLVVVNDLLEDLRFATARCGASTPDRVAARDGIFAITDKLRALKGELDSPQFIDRFVGVAAQYADVMRSARPCFTEIKDSTVIEPPQFGDELFVLGTGINGLIPWMYMDDVDEWIRYDRTRNANA